MCVRLVAFLTGDFYSEICIKWHKTDYTTYCYINNLISDFWVICHKAFRKLILEIIATVLVQQKLEKRDISVEDVYAY